MDYTYQEILRQPATWRETLHYLQEKESYCSQFLNEKHDNVIFTGCGSSYNLSLSASHLWQAGKQVPARGVPSSETFLFPQGVFLPQNHYLIFGISRSGETTETVKALQHFQDKFKGKTIGVSCEENSSASENSRLPGGSSFRSRRKCSDDSIFFQYVTIFSLFILLP